MNTPRPHRKPPKLTSDTIYKWAALVVRLVTVIAEFLDRHWR
jgi:hypothetical protein